MMILLNKHGEKQLCLNFVGFKLHFV